MSTLMLGKILVISTKYQAVYFNVPAKAPMSAYKFGDLKYIRWGNVFAV